MKSQWNDSAARQMVEAYAATGVGQDIALRVYTTRLLGRDPLLVLHGGGNTSVKTKGTDDLGQEHEVIAVKGSGADMADIEPCGPADGEARTAADSCARSTALSDEDDGQRAATEPARIPPRPTPRSRRCCMPSCRTNSSTTRMPPPCCRWSTSPTARPWRARSTTVAWGSCLTSRRASASPRWPRRCSSKTRKSKA